MPNNGWENYLKQTQEFSSRLDQEVGALQELLHFIEVSKDQAEQHQIDEAFFKAEYAFYNSQYDIALKHYLEAGNIPNIEFFCYRVSSYVSKSQGHTEKALKFAKKAIEIYPQDPFATNLIKELSEVQIEVKTEVKAEVLQPPSFESISKISIGQREIEDLARLFMADAGNSVAPSYPALHSANDEEPLSPPQESKPEIQERKEYAPAVNDRLHVIQCGQSKSYYLRWNHKGIVINPGKGFVEGMNQAAISVHDIDYVIVLNTNLTFSNDLQKLYALVAEVNQQGSYHRIHYYLPSELYQTALHCRPSPLKQSAKVLHELLFSSENKEGTLTLKEGIEMAYFMEGDTSFEERAIGVNFKLDGEEAPASVNIGFIEKMQWDPMLSYRLKDSQILIVDVDTLDKPGVQALLRDLSPQLLLCRFDHADQKEMLDTIKKLRNEQEFIQFPIILPMDEGCVMRLSDKHIRETLQGEFVHPSSIHAINLGKEHLLFLSSSCCL